MADAPPAKPLLRVREVAEILGLSVPRVYELVAAQSLPSVRLSERGIRIPREALDAWLAACAERAVDNLSGRR